MIIGRIKRRWTLGGFMVLIAIVAVPLAMYARRPRPVEYPERVAWQALAESRVRTSRNAARNAQETAARGRAAVPNMGGPPR
jgi:hypothetical protein